MSPAEVAKLLILIGLAFIFFSFIFAVVNITGLIPKKKSSRRSGAQLVGFGEPSQFNASFKRHGLAMIGMVIGIALIMIATYVGGIELVKGILRQFGINI